MMTDELLFHFSLCFLACIIVHYGMHIFHDKSTLEAEINKHTKEKTND